MLKLHYKMRVAQEKLCLYTINEIFFFNANLFKLWKVTFGITSSDSTMFGKKSTEMLWICYSKCYRGYCQFQPPTRAPTGLNPEVVLNLMNESPYFSRYHPKILTPYSVYLLRYYIKCEFIGMSNYYFLLFY